MRAISRAGNGELDDTYGIVAADRRADRLPARTRRLTVSHGNGQLSAVRGLMGVWLIRVYTCRNLCSFIGVPMLSIVRACAVVGLEGCIVEVQTDFNPRAGLPTFTIV